MPSTESIGAARSSRRSVPSPCSGQESPLQAPLWLGWLHEQVVELPQGSRTSDPSSLRVTLPRMTGARLYRGHSWGPQRAE